MLPLILKMSKYFLLRNPPILFRCFRTVRNAKFLLPLDIRKATWKRVALILRIKELPICHY
jgi:hypothetical protein